jgi:hypothetical protein
MSFYSFDNSKLRCLDLKDFDFSCKTPVEVFDVSSGDAGNVRSAFVSHASKFNDELVDYIFGIYKDHGIPTSDELIAKIKAFPKSTTCMDGAGGSGGTSGDAGVASSGGTGGASFSSGGKGGQAGTSSSGGAAGGSAGSSRSSGGSSGCSCGLGGSRRAQGQGVCLLVLGMVACRRRRRRDR